MLFPATLPFDLFCVICVSFPGNSNGAQQIEHGAGGLDIMFQLLETYGTC
jgi:hypothetical protein